MYYRITNGQVEQVTSLPNVSGAELYLASLPVAQRQSMGIFAGIKYGDYAEPICNATQDCIFTPMPIVLPVVEQPFAISKILLKKEMKAIARWDDFKSYLAQDPDANEDFELAGVLMSNNEDVLRFEMVCAMAFGLPNSQIKAMLQRCKSDI